MGASEKQPAEQCHFFRHYDWSGLTFPPVSAIPQRTSLPAETARILREGLSSGRWAGCLPGEHELCAELRVSRMTLRAAIDQLARERLLEKGGHGRRHRIMAPAATVRSTLDIRSGKVRVLSQTPPENIVGVMERALAELQRGLATDGIGYHYHHRADLNRRDAGRTLASLVDANTRDGWVLCGLPAAVQHWFASRCLPAMVLGARAPGVALPHVEFASSALARHAGGQFLHYGHSRLALLRSSLEMTGETECEAGLREAATSHAEVVEIVCGHCTNSRPTIRLAMDRLLAAKPVPTAFLVTQPQWVGCVLARLKRAGMRVPEDVAVISRGDDLFLQLSDPEVTRYAYDGPRLGRAAARLMLQVLAQPGLPLRSTVIIPEFVQGETLVRAVKK